MRTVNLIAAVFAVALTCMVLFCALLTYDKHFIAFLEEKFEQSVNLTITIIIYFNYILIYSNINFAKSIVFQN